MDINKTFYIEKLKKLRNRIRIIIFLSILCWVLINGIYLFTFEYRIAIRFHIKLFLFILSCIFLFLLNYCFYIGIQLCDKIINIYSLPNVSFPDPPAQSNTITLLLCLLSNLETTQAQQYQYLLLQKEAQLDAMQSQIQPHFLYNALDSIRGLALNENALQTAEMTEALSVFYRNSIDNSTKMCPLEQELKNVENYVKIQRFRFGNRFELVKNISSHILPLLDTYYLPKLIIQPLVENAIYHGIDRRTAGGIITLSIITTQSRLLISIKDNGQGIASKSLAILNQSFAENSAFPNKKNDNSRTGIALTNINSRIKMIYGNEYGLTAYSMEGMGSEFQIRLPLKYSISNTERSN